MWSPRALLLLLAACLAVRADPVPPPDDIQVQENFDVSRVRLALLVVVVVAGCLKSWASLGKSGLSRGLSPQRPFLLRPSGILGFFEATAIYLPFYGTLSAGVL